MAQVSLVHRLDLRIGSCPRPPPTPPLRLPLTWRPSLLAQPLRSRSPMPSSCSSDARVAPRPGSPHTERAYRCDLRRFPRLLSEPDRSATPTCAAATPRRYITLLSTRRAARAPSADASRRSTRSTRFLRGIDAVTRNPFAVSRPAPLRSQERDAQGPDRGPTRTCRRSSLGRRRRRPARARSSPREPSTTRAFGKLFVAARRRACFMLMSFAGLRATRCSDSPRRLSRCSQTASRSRSRAKGPKRASSRSSASPIRPSSTGSSCAERYPPASTTVFVSLNGNRVGYDPARRDCDVHRQTRRVRVHAHALTCSAAPAPRADSKRRATSAPSKSFWGTPASRRRRSTRTSPLRRCASSSRRPASRPPSDHANTHAAPSSGRWHDR